jgi:hypothetical protein
MNNERLMGYELWDVTLPPLPPRSRLYYLAPIGLGTPYVESLTGYVARLAETHNVRTRTLVVHELIPLLGRRHLSKEVNNSLSSFWAEGTRAVNGIRTLARDWGQVLQELTGRRDLHFLTLSTWAEVLTPKGLLRPTRAWCPACYEEWAQAGQPVYEPLLWTVEVVKVCPRHRRRLSARCPYPDCGQTLPLLGPDSKPGYCSRCDRWLGIPETTAPVGNQVPAEDELRWQTWVVDSVGELLAAAPGLAAPPRKERIAQAIAACVEQGMVRGLATVSCELGLHRDRVRYWLKRGGVPQLDLLLRLCHRFGISPLHFLTEEPLIVDRAKMNTPMRKEPTRIHRTPPRPLDVEQVRLALEAVLMSDEHPPPAMRQIAKRLGRHHATLIQHFPELCHSISARYKAYGVARGLEKRQRLCDEVRQAVLTVDAKAVYPSAAQVAKLLRTPGAIRHPDAQATWHEMLRELGWAS